jgi:hypothetical protein
MLFARELSFMRSDCQSVRCKPLRIETQILFPNSSRPGESPRLCLTVALKMRCTKGVILLHLLRTLRWLNNKILQSSLLFNRSIFLKSSVVIDDSFAEKANESSTTTLDFMKMERLNNKFLQSSPLSSNKSSSL